MKTRTALEQDSEDIRNIYLSAFPESEREIVAKLAVNLLSEETGSPIISLLAEYDKKIVGHIAFSPVTINTDKDWKGYILAPLAVKPEYQNQRVGSELINHGIKELSEKGVNTLFVYGDPEYYSRFGFDTETATPYLAPYDLQYPSGWQALVLNEFNIETEPMKISCVDSLCKPDMW